MKVSKISLSISFPFCKNSPSFSYYNQSRPRPFRNDLLKLISYVLTPLTIVGHVLFLPIAICGTTLRESVQN
ncbi:hypothetical protein V2G26_005691 [Clonostachys chloroleuca]